MCIIRLQTLVCTVGCRFCVPRDTLLCAAGCPPFVYSYRGKSLCVPWDYLFLYRGKPLCTTRLYVGGAGSFGESEVSFLLKSGVRACLGHKDTIVPSVYD